MERLDNPAFQKHARLNFWKDTDAAEMQVFVAHLLIMGMLRKPTIESYWKRSGMCQTPFFGKWMTRNRFCSILANMHIADDSMNPAFGNSGHDPLAKLRPFLDMCDETFRFVYRPSQNISIDESCCPFKGRLRFKVYNPRKPAKFHIKQFLLCEADSGYVVGFRTYTGKGSCVDETACLDEQCTTTTKVVMSLARFCGVLDKGHHITFDNYYTSPELLEELLYRNTTACGVCEPERSSRCGDKSKVEQR